MRDINKSMRAFRGEQLIQVEKVPDTDRILKVTCLLCNEVVFDEAVAKSEKPALSALGITAHFEIRHQVALYPVDCNDIGCSGNH